MLRKFFIGILFLLFILLFIPVAMSFGFYSTFLNRDFYEVEFAKMVYEFALDEVPRNANLKDLPLSENKLKQILQTVFNENDLIFMIESFFNQLKELEVEDNGTVNLQISLDWLRKKNDIVANNVASALVEDLPTCSVKSVPLTAFPKCIPEEISKTDFKHYVGQALDRELLSSIPNEIALNFSVPSNISGNLFEYFNEMILKILTIGFLVLVFILGFMSLLIFSPWNAILKKVSKAVFFASLNIFVLLLALLLIPVKIFSDYGIDQYLRIYSFIVSALTSNMLLYISPLILFAFLGWMSMIFYEKNIKTKT